MAKESVKVVTHSRDDLAAKLVAQLPGLQMKQAHDVLAALFGSGGSGTLGPRERGLLEILTDEVRGMDQKVNIRGFGIFKRTRLKSREVNFGGEKIQSKEKLKLSFRASGSTDM